MPEECHESREMNYDGMPGANSNWDDREQYLFWWNLTHSGPGESWHANFTNDHPEYEYPAKGYGIYTDDTLNRSWALDFDTSRVGNALLDFDSDGDGLTDYAEVKGCETNGLDTCEDSENATESFHWRSDSSGNGLLDHEEREEGTDPFAWDDSGDGLPDGWLTFYGFNASEEHDTSQSYPGELSLTEQYCWASGVFNEERADGDPDCPDGHANQRIVNWCGPDPNVNDTSENGTIDANEEKDHTYGGCNSPTPIGEGPDSEDLDGPTYDLGYIDPKSDDWLETGQTVEQYASDPVNTFERTVNDPTQIAAEIAENTTNDTQTATRYVLPPAVHSTTWETTNDTLYKVKVLRECLEGDDDVLDRFQDLDLVDDPLPDSNETDAFDSVQCALDELKTADDTSPAPSILPLVTDPILPQAQVLGDRSLSGVTKTVGNLTSANVSETNATVDLRSLATQEGGEDLPSSGDFHDVAQDPWSLVKDTNAFPTLTSDLLNNEHSDKAGSETLWDTFVQADEATEQVNVIGSVDSSHWNLLVGYPNGSYEESNTSSAEYANFTVLPNTPLEGTKPVWFDDEARVDDCDIYLVDGEKGDTDFDCENDLANATVNVTVSSVGAENLAEGYNVSVEHNAEETDLLIAPFVQIPDEEQVLGIGTDTLLDKNAIPSVETLGDYPNQLEVELSTSTLEDGIFRFQVNQDPAASPLNLGSTLFTVNTTDEEKQAQPHPRQSGSLLLVDDLGTLDATIERNGTSDTGHVEWTGSANATVATTAQNARENRTEGAVTVFDPMPAEGQATLEDSSTTTALDVNLSDVPSGTEFQVKAWEDANGTLEHLNGRIVDPPTDLSLSKTEDAPGTTNVSYQADAAFETAEMTHVDNSEQDCEIPADDNRISVGPNCTHVNLTGLVSGYVETTGQSLETSWTRDRNDNSLAISTRGDNDVNVDLDPWPAAGDANVDWASGLDTEWNLDESIDLDLLFDANAAGNLSVDGLPANGDLDIDPAASSPVALAVGGDRIDKLSATYGTTDELPEPPDAERDHLFVKETGDGETLARSLLHDLGSTNVSLEQDRASLDAKLQSGHPFGLHLDLADTSIEADLLHTPDRFSTEIEREGDTRANLTFDLSHSGSSSTLPDVTFNGTVDGVDFDLEATDVPETVSAYADTEAQEFELQSESPLTVSGTLVGESGQAPEVAELQQTGVSFTLDEGLEDLPAAEIELEGVQEVRFNKSDETTGTTEAELLVNANQTNPLRAGSSAGDTSRVIDVSGLPTGADVRLNVSDDEGDLEYEASHEISNLDIVSITPDEEFVAEIENLPTNLSTEWTVPDDLTNGTAQLHLDHDGDARYPSASAQWVQETGTGDDPPLTVRSGSWEDIPPEVNFTLEGRTSATLELPTGESIGSFSGFFADDVPEEDLLVPEGPQSIFYQRTTADRTQLGFDLADIHAFEDLRFPTPADPSVDLRLETDGDSDHPLEVSYEDQVDETEFDLQLDSFGGGVSEILGDVVVDPEDNLTANLSIGLGESPQNAYLSYAGEDQWFEGNLSTEATTVETGFNSSGVLFEADDYADIEFHAAPLGSDAPEDPSRSYALADATGNVTSVGVNISAVKTFNAAFEDDGHVRWDIQEPQPLAGAYTNETLQLRSLNVSDLPASGEVSWNTTDGFDSTVKLRDEEGANTSVDRLHVNATLPGEGDDRVYTDLHAEELPSFEFEGTPDSGAALEADDSIAELRGQVLIGENVDQRLDHLDGKRGLLFEEPSGESVDDQNASLYDVGVAFNISEPETFDVDLETAHGTMRLNGTLTLGQAVDEPLQLRANREEATWLNATASNLPRETELTVELGDVDAATAFREGATGVSKFVNDEDVTLELDVGPQAIGSMQGAFRTEKSTSDETNSSVYTGNFTASDLARLNVATDGRFAEEVDLDAGGEFDHLFVRAQNETVRYRTQIHGADGNYTGTLVDEGKTGTLDLDAGNPADRLRIEYKDIDDASRNSTHPQYLLGALEQDPDPETEETNLEIDYLHAALRSLESASWDATPDAGIEASLSTGSDPLELELDHQALRGSMLVSSLPETLNTTADFSENPVLEIDTDAPFDIDRLRIKELAEGSAGIEDHEGQMVNKTLQLGVDNLNSTRLELQQDEITPHTETSFSALNRTQLDLDTEGMQSLSGWATEVTEDNPEQARQLVLQAPQVPTTEAEFAHMEPLQGSDAHQNWTSAVEHEDENTFLANLSSTAELGPVETYAMQPVSHEHTAFAVVDLPTAEKVSFREQTEPTQDDGNETGVQQDVLFVDLASVKEARLEVDDPPEACSGCSGFNVSLDRDDQEEAFAAYANTTWGGTSFDGTIQIQDLPGSTDVAFWSGDTWETVDGPDGEESIKPVSKIMVDYQGTGEMRGIDVNTTVEDVNDSDEAPFVVSGTVGKLPPASVNASFDHGTEQHEALDEPACGADFTNRLPARAEAHLRDADTYSLENVDLRLGPETDNPIDAPDDAKNFVGATTGEDPFHLYLNISEVDHLDLDISTFERRHTWVGALNATADLGVEDITFQLVNGTDAEPLWDARFEGLENPVSVGCEGARITAGPDLQKVDAGEPVFERLNLTVTDFPDLLNRTVEDIQFELTDLQGEATLEPGVLDEQGRYLPSASGLGLHDAYGGELGGLDVVGDLEPLDSDETEACESGAGGDGGGDDGNTIVLNGSLPVDEVEVTLSTASEQDRPSEVDGNTDVWLVVETTCEERTIDVYWEDLEGIAFENRGRSDSFALRQANPTVGIIDVTTMDSDEPSAETNNRVEVDQIPKHFEISTTLNKINAETVGDCVEDQISFEASFSLSGPEVGVDSVDDRCLLITSNSTIQEFILHQDENCMIRMEDIEPRDEQSLDKYEVGNVFFDWLTDPLHSGCPLTADAMGLVAEMKSAGELALRATAENSGMALDATVEGVEGSLGYLTDVAGYSEYHDLPRFANIQGEFDDADATLTNESDGTGVSLEYGSLAGANCKITEEGMPRWWDKPLAGASKSRFEGAIDHCIDRGEFDNRCLKWTTVFADGGTYKECVYRETNREVAERVAQKYFDDLVHFNDGYREKALPPEAFVPMLLGNDV